MKSFQLNLGRRVYRHGLPQGYFEVTPKCFVVLHVVAKLAVQGMSRIPSQGTRPENIIRRASHRPGYRFRLHRQKLPSPPDIAFRDHRKVIFVRGADASVFITHPAAPCSTLLRRAATPSRSGMRLSGSRSASCIKLRHQTLHDQKISPR